MYTKFNKSTTWTIRQVYFKQQVHRRMITYLEPGSDHEIKYTCFCIFYLDHFEDFGTPVLSPPGPAVHRVNGIQEDLSSGSSVRQQRLILSIICNTHNTYKHMHARISHRQMQTNRLNCERKWLMSSISEPKKHTNIKSND